MPKILINGIITRMAFWGLLLALGAPGWDFWILPWVALIVPFRWAARQERSGTVFQGGFRLGSAYAGLVCLWFFDLHPLTWLGFSEWGSRLVTLAGWALIAVENGLLVGALLWLYRLLPGSGWRLALFPLLWVLGFALFNVTPLALPWTSLEYTQVALPAMRWLSGWISGSGLAVLLILHNVFWAELYPPHPNPPPPGGRGFNSLTKKSPLPPGGGGLGWGGTLPRVLIFPLLIAGLGLLPPFAHPPKARLPLPVAVFQANLPIEVIRSANLSSALIEAVYLDPLRRMSLPPGALAAYPEEGVVSGEVSQWFPDGNPGFKRLQELARSKRVYVSVGVSLLDEMTGRRYNALALLSPEGRAQFYRKRRLVPFGEYTPYGLESGLDALLAAWNVGYSASFSEGTDSRLLRAGAARLGALVCFELIDSWPFGHGYAWQYKRQGASLLVNASNLGWFHQNPWLEAQFLAMARLRAAETRLPLVLASNTGISAILSPGGDVLAHSEPAPMRRDSERSFPHKTRILFYNGQ